MNEFTEKTSCCSPSGQGKPFTPAAIARDPIAAKTAYEAAVPIPGGMALVGTNQPILPQDGESPLRRVRVKPFRIGATAVTNAEFAAFVAATGYVTEAEWLDWSFVFHLQVPQETGFIRGVEGIEWWRQVFGANWRAINGPGSESDAFHPDHPVVQVSWNDARAYADWVGGRLPREAEWEHAARGGLEDARFPWGDQEPDDTEFLPCNIWQGTFPNMNTAADKWLTTAPARSFAPNGYGLYNVVGNVWEWTADAYRIASLKRGAQALTAEMRGRKLLKGGSFLCHRSYCYRYRIAARSHNTPDSATTHQGFRVVWPG